MNNINAYEDNSEKLITDQFILQYQPLVKKIALFIKRRLPSHIDLDDLIQSGLVGLLEASKGFQEGLGASFETYASIRIKGSMIDSLRKNSWASRDTIKNMKRISEAISQVEQRKQAHASAEEIAKEIGVSIEEYFKISQEISFCSVLSLDEIEQDSIPGEGEDDNPQEITQNEFVKSDLKTILAGLPEREQLVLSLYYVDELTLKQIGEVLEITEARVCQLHSQAIARVKSKFSGVKQKDQPEKLNI